VANPEHYEILLQGVEAWNKWRETYPDITPDLSEAYLFGVNLYGGNDITNLTKVNLSGAELKGARLIRVNLEGANLVRAKLHWADLRDADLSGANLREANLVGTVFGEFNCYWDATLDTYIAITGVTRFDGTDFSHARMGSTVFDKVDLSTAKGLDTVKHDHASTIGVDTLYFSQGRIPEVFLRGAGIPERLITYIPSLLDDPLQFYSCFISYSSKDEEFAKRLYNDLQSEGVRCWFAPEHLKIGDRLRVRIDESIRLYDKLLLVLSENSVSSEWVGDEVEAALEKEEGPGGKAVLFPLRLDDAVMEIKLGWPAKVRRTRHIGDFSDWKNHDSYKKAFERLMRDLKASG
jgi:uncharacterized protein YjbI with pentapeptide repeats